MKKFLYVTLSLLVALLSSCSETSEENNEFDDWQNRNDAYFTNIYNKAKTAIGNGDTSWKIIRNYTKNPETTEPTHHIVVKVLAEEATAASEGAPMFTDSVKVHYRGYLMPSASYQTSVAGYPDVVGFQFDSSWYGDYNLPAMTPTSGVPANYVDGFATALMGMHRGDRWLVYMPYKLGYDTASKSNIPAYSLLIFEMTLSDFFTKRIK